MPTPTTQTLRWLIAAPSVESARAGDHLSADIVRLGVAEHADGAGGFLGQTGTAERDHAVRGFGVRRLDADVDLPAGDIDLRALAGLRLGEARLDQAEGHAVHVDEIAT